MLSLEVGSIFAVSGDGERLTLPVLFGGRKERIRDGLEQIYDGPEDTG
jgi:hypothetical protein